MGELKPTSEVDDNVMNVEIMLPRGIDMAQGCIILRKSDSEDNPIGRANTNLILYSREYILKMDDREEISLTANTITQLLYSQCDPEVNQYVMFDSIIDFSWSITAFCHKDQKIIRN